MRRKEVLKTIRDHVEIDCNKVYSDTRKDSQRHKFYMCEDPEYVVTEINSVIEEYGFYGIKAEFIDYIPPVDVYSIPSKSVEIKFPNSFYK